MASRYIPPHLRSKQQDSQKQHHPSPEANAKERNPSDGYSADEIANQFGCAPDTKVGTLNAAEADESKLAFVLVFKDQHPEWPPRIFCKSNLHLLTASASPTPNGGTLPETSGAEDLPTHPIPLFTQDSLTTSTPGKWKIFFKGWYHIQSVTYLEPKSPELIKMLDGKFTPAGKKRSPEAWEQSLGMRWGVVEFVPLGEGDGAKRVGACGKGDGEGDGRGEEEKGNPIVPLKPMVGKKTKSVREMLEEMRLRDEKTGTVQGVS
ncbi:MAG: hypothetical protein Q9181_005241 [Wetmoreana brouardii]